MTLAARCPACRTAFRVVADQLRVSGGWVRCGRCGDVFNANETLFDLRALAATASAPPADTAPVSEPVSAPPAEQAPLESGRGDTADEMVAAHGPIEPTDERQPEPVLEPTAAPVTDGTPEPTFEPEVPPAMPSAAPMWVEGPRLPEAPAPWSHVEEGEHGAGAQAVDVEPSLPAADHDATPAIAPVENAARDAVAPPAASADERSEPSLAAEATEAAPASADATAAASVDATTAASADTTTAAAPEAEAPATPGFVREAERAERWQSAEMRALLGGAAVLLAGAALIQGLRGFHAPLTAAWPQARTWVEPLCRIAGCQVEPRRRLGALSVEGSSLVQLDGSALTRLSLVLRNRDPGDVLMPAIELSLTDVQGTVVARKVFAAAELGASEATIAGGAELALQGVLDTGGLPVVGYTLELFYP